MRASILDLHGRHSEADLVGLLLDHSCIGRFGTGDAVCAADAIERRLRCFVDETLVMATVRDAGPADADAAEAVWAAVAAEGEWIGTELPLRPGWGDRFRAALTAPESSWFVAEVGGLVVGGVFVQDTHGVAHLGMAVLESNRGAGLGRSLLNAAVGWARDRGCHKVTLEVWPHNTHARRLYESGGFADEGYLKRHYRRKSGALWDAVVMALILDNDSPGRP